MCLQRLIDLSDWRPEGIDIDTFEATIAETTRLPLDAQGYSLALGMAALRAQENQHLTSTSDLEIRRQDNVASDLICLSRLTRKFNL
jgi:hypothetical protein